MGPGTWGTEIYYMNKNLKMKSNNNFHKNLEKPQVFYYMGLNRMMTLDYGNNKLTWNI
jgi:hypothetical protein